MGRAKFELPPFPGYNFQLNEHYICSYQGFIQDFWLGGGGEKSTGVSTKRGNVRGLGDIPPPRAPQKILRIWPP